MNFKTTWILLAGALGLFAYIFSVERLGEESSRPKAEALLLFPDLNPAKAGRVEVVRTATIQVAKDNDQWRLAIPEYPAQSASIESFLEAVGKLVQHDYISAQEVMSQPGGLAPFGLEPPRMTITILEGTNRHSLLVGKPTPVRDQVYVKLLGSAGIAITDASFLEYAPLSADEWRDPMLMHLPRVPFDRLEVKAPGRGFEFQREPGGGLWRLTQPLPARADNNRIENLIQQLRMARVSHFVTDDPRIDLEAFGLQQPQVDLVVAQGTNQLARIQFGKSPDDDPALVYARRFSHNNIVLVQKELMELLRLSDKEYRDRNLLDFAFSEVDSIEVNGREPLKIERRENGLWQILDPYNMPADSLLMQEFLGNLRQIQIVDFVKDVVADFSDYGLEPPARRVTLNRRVNSEQGGTNQVLAQIDLSAKQAESMVIMARRWDERSVYALSYPEVTRAPQGAFELRDRRVWNFAPGNVTAVTVSQKGNTRQWVRHPGRGWSQNEILNAAMEEILHRLGQLRALAWVERGETRMGLFGFGEMDFQIDLELAVDKKTQNLTIHFGKLSPRGNYYAALRLPGDSERTIFEFPALLFSDIWRELTVSLESRAP
jgi:hypothetical protein